MHQEIHHKRLFQGNTFICNFKSTVRPIKLWILRRRWLLSDSSYELLFALLLHQTEVLNMLSSYSTVIWSHWIIFDLTVSYQKMEIVFLVYLPLPTLSRFTNEWKWGKKIHLFIVIIKTTSYFPLSRRGGKGVNKKEPSPSAGWATLQPP